MEFFYPTWLMAKLHRLNVLSQKILTSKIRSNYQKLLIKIINILKILHINYKILCCFPKHIHEFIYIYKCWIWTIFCSLNVRGSPESSIINLLILYRHLSSLKKKLSLVILCTYFSEIFEKFKLVIHQFDYSPHNNKIWKLPY